MLRWASPDEALRHIQREAEILREAVKREKLAPKGLSHWIRAFLLYQKYLRYRHSMTDYPCKLPDGTMGKVAMRKHKGEYIAVCVWAPSETPKGYHYR